jgi:hypothetical protein
MGSNLSVKNVLVFPSKPFSDHFGTSLKTDFLLYIFITEQISIFSFQYSTRSKTSYRSVSAERPNFSIYIHMENAICPKKNFKTPLTQTVLGLAPPANLDRLLEHSMRKQTLVHVPFEQIQFTFDLSAHLNRK